MKKVLSLVLTLALVLSSFSMAFADDAATATAEPTPAGKAGMTLSDVAKSPNKEAIGVVNDLGIVLGTPEGTFLPEKDVTRAEFAAMITRALAIPKSALEGYQQTPFKDMAGYEWANGYIAFCVSKGIMVGDGMGNAMPGRTVTLNEAVTMALRAVGYVDNSAHLKGAWPANFVTKAQELGLYEKVAKDSVVANRETAAQLIYNLLPVQKVAVETDGKTVYVQDEKGNEVNLLTAGLNAKAEDPDVVTVSGLDDSAINMAKYLGMYGTKYTTNRGKNKKTVAFMPEKELQMLVGRITDGGKKFVTTDDEVTYDFEDKDAVVTAYLMNGIAQTAIAPSNAAFNNVEVTLFAEVSGKKIKKHALNSDGKVVTALVINKWVVTHDKKVEASDLDSLKNARLLGKKFAKDGDKVDLNKFQLVGAATLEDIKADNIVYVYAEGADKKIVRVEVGTETVEGTVNRFKTGSVTDGTADKFKIGDKEYKNADNVLNFEDKDDDAVSVKDVDITADVKVLLDARGFVYHVDKTTKADKYALVIKEDTGIDHRAKLLLADGTEKVYTVKLTGNAELGAIEPNNETGLVVYGVSGKENDLKVTEKGTEEIVKKFDTDGITFVSNAIAKVGAKYYTIKKDVVVFMYKGTAGVATAEYKLTTIDKVNKEKNQKEVRALVKGDKISVLLVSDVDAKAGDSKYAVVNKATKINSNGDIVLEVEGLIDGQAFTKKTDDVKDNLFNAAANYNAKTVQLFDVTVNKEDVITGAAEVVENANEGITSDKLNTKVKHNTVFFPVTETLDRRGVKILNGIKLNLSEKVVIYRLNDDSEYEVMSGAPKETDYVKAYEVDGEEGYDVVFVISQKDPTAVIVNPDKATAGDEKFTITAAQNKKFVITDSKDFYAVKSNGTVGTAKDTIEMAVADIDNAVAGAGDLEIDRLGNKKLKNGKAYQVIEVKEATASVAPDVLKGTIGKNDFAQAGNVEVVVVTLEGATVGENKITAIADVAEDWATNVDSGTTKVVLALEPLGNVATGATSFKIKATAAAALVTTSGEKTVNVSIAKGKLVARELVNNDYFVLPDNVETTFKVKVE